MVYFTIDKNAVIPIYQQIIRQVEDKIADRSVKHMDLMPSEKQFSEIYNVSSFVVKRAYGELRKKGLVFSVKGKGTFVSNRLVYEVNFFDTLSLVCPSIRGYDYKILSIEKVDYDEHAYRHLNKKRGDVCFKISWITFDQCTPIAYITILLSEDCFPNMMDILEKKIPLKDFLTTNEMIKASTQTHIVNAANADQILAQILEIENNDPIVVIQTVLTNSIVYSKTIYPGNYLKVWAEL